MTLLKKLCLGSRKQPKIQIETIRGTYLSLNGFAPRFFQVLVFYNHASICVMWRTYTGSCTQKKKKKKESLTQLLTLAVPARNEGFGAGFMGPIA